MSSESRKDFFVFIFFFFAGGSLDLAVIGIRLLRALVASDTMNPSEAMVHIFTFGKVIDAPSLPFFLLVLIWSQVLDALGNCRQLFVISAL